MIIEYRYKGYIIKRNGTKSMPWNIYIEDIEGDANYGDHVGEGYTLAGCKDAIDKGRFEEDQDEYFDFKAKMKKRRDKFGIKTELGKVDSKERIQERASTGKVRSALFGDKRHLIKTFAVLTGENPMGKKLSDIENRQRNKRLRKNIEDDRRADMEKRGLSKEDFFRKLHIQYIPIQGKFGNDEHSYIVINLSLEDAKKYSELFEQMSFFFGEHTKDDKIIVSYYERARKEDDFELIEQTERIDNAQDFDDFFSKYNGLKWSFYLKYFNEEYNLREIINEDFLNKSLDDSYTMMGRALYRRRAYKESYKGGDIVEHKGVMIENCLRRKNNEKR